MDEKPEALRLADAPICERSIMWQSQATAELRRLSGIEFALRDCEKALEGMATKYMDASDQRDELLELLKSVVATRSNHFINNEVEGMWGWDKKARAAIAKAEEKNHG